MKRALALILAVVLVFACSMTAFARSSRSSGGGGGSTIQGRKATTYVASEGETAQWVKNADGTWSAILNGVKLANTWALLKNPYDGNQSQWFFFNANGVMLTGWQKINGKWYLLNPAASASNGALYMNGTTYDGYLVRATGEWVG